jgi:hypothetical protein
MNRHPILRSLIVTASITVAGSHAWAQATGESPSSVPPATGAGAATNTAVVLGGAHQFADGYYMSGGTIIVVRGGQRTMMDRDITLPNGVLITRNGTVTLPDGNTTTLRAGQMLGMDGRIASVAAAPDAGTGTGTAPAGSTGTGASGSVQAGATGAGMGAATGTGAGATGSGTGSGMGTSGTGTGARSGGGAGAGTTGTGTGAVDGTEGGSTGGSTGAPGSVKAGGS